jgi:hypothetical protein
MLNELVAIQSFAELEAKIQELEARLNEHTKVAGQIGQAR